jgi:hypothetical protein
LTQHKGDTSGDEATFAAQANPPRNWWRAILVRIPPTPALALKQDREFDIPVHPQCFKPYKMLG